MRVGFTGTRQGMSDRQLLALMELLKHLRLEEAIHGGCVGADTQFHRFCLTLSIPVIVCPSVHKSQQGNWEGAEVVHEELPPLERNHIIVNLCDLLIAAPKSNEEELRSGTWATIRYARDFVPTTILPR